MQVSAIVPILLNIIRSEQQSQKQSSREQVDFRQLLQGQPARTPSPASAPGEKAAAARPGSGSAEGGEPVLLPLPLRSPLFPDTQFYVFRRQGEESREQEDAEQETGIVFSLATAGLGRLFFMLTRKAESIGITCHTQTGAVAARLNSRAAELEEQVRQAGFEQVTFRCLVLDPKLAGEPAGFSSPGLLDLKV